MGRLLKELENKGIFSEVGFNNMATLYGELDNIDQNNQNNCISLIKQQISNYMIDYDNKVNSFVD